MRRRRSLEQGDDSAQLVSTKTTNIYNSQFWSTAGIIISLILATILNRHVYNLHIGDKGSFVPIHVGDFIDVRLPILSGSKRVDDTICSGRILTSNISSFLVLISGHALEGAQWMPRERVFRPGPLVPTSANSCSLTNAAISSSPVSDRCSRFMSNFCVKEWEKHPRTRQFANFECTYPTMSNDTDISSSAWFLAQSIGKSRGLCPDPAILMWPPSKITYPSCSSSLVKNSQEMGMSLDAHFKFPEGSDHLYQLQKQSFLQGLCPAPEMFRWTPDNVMWPDCESWIRTKCVPGALCSLLDGTHKWSSDVTQRSFADAQNWCAGRGKCPSSLEGRWRPGLLFYPDCSELMLGWCRDRDLLDECRQPEQWNVANRMNPRADIPKRIQAQAWAHGTMNACPDPFSEFVWSEELTKSN